MNAQYRTLNTALTCGNYSLQIILSNKKLACVISMQICLKCCNNLHAIKGHTIKMPVLTAKPTLRANM